MALLGLVGQFCVAENTPKVALDNNEALFSVLTAINACGYDSDLSVSVPLRAEIRAEVTKTIEASPGAKESTAAMCQFYSEHQQDDPGRTLAQYVSLALFLNPPPELTLKVKEAELPPDASFVSGFVQPLQKFYGEAGLHAIWIRHQAAYADLTARYHEPLSKVLFDTEVYLKLPSAGFLGRAFTVYLDPMGSPGQANARNYGADYYVIISPGTSSSLKVDQIRHTYLHYLLDPLALKYPAAISHLKPLLDNVKSAPMDESFKTDASLLMTECLIRAVEARTIGTSKTPETQRQQLVEQSVQQGFILTPYFYQALIKFEKSPAGLRIAYGDMVSGIDVRKEQKNVAEIKFASKADPELLHLSRPADTKLLMTAEQRLSTGDPEGAKKLAQQALDEKKEDPGRALFILAEVATMNRDMQGARNYFQQALGVAHEPKVLAWSHIYLGRIFDLQEDREAALDQYRAALSAGGSLPEAKAAAEHGIAQPYEPPSHPQQ
ncbi:MAG TPA: tetratricopeptide repeat protein [Terriglobales bacterium]|nr:tetratricopeptide repeat protein [Terriglobales bacterium]